MDKTNQEIWEEALRTAEALKKAEPHQIEPLEKKMVIEENVSVEDVPVGYISDAQALTSLLLELKNRGVEVD